MGVIGLSSTSCSEMQNYFDMKIARFLCIDPHVHHTIQLMLLTFPHTRTLREAFGPLAFDCLFCSLVAVLVLCRVCVCTQTANVSLCINNTHTHERMPTTPTTLQVHEVFSVSTKRRRVSLVLPANQTGRVFIHSPILSLCIVTLESAGCSRARVYECVCVCVKFKDAHSHIRLSHSSRHQRVKLVFRFGCVRSQF